MVINNEQISNNEWLENEKVINHCLNQIEVFQNLVVGHLIST